MRLVETNVYRHKETSTFMLLEKKLEDTPDEKLEKEHEKAGQEIIKKLKQNFERFKSAAGKKIEEYKKFFDKQKETLFSLQKKYPVNNTYSLFDSEYIVASLEDKEGKKLGIFKRNLEPDEENPVFLVKDKVSMEAFRKFLKDMIQDMKDMKEYYKKNIESQKKKEEYEKRKKKLDVFLKENSK